MQLNTPIRTALQIALWTALGWHAASSADPVVTTSGGAVRGVAQASTQVFYGIPYAKPPLGALRWRAPQPAPRWKGVRAATTPSAACYQPPPQEFGPYTAEFLIPGPVSEDCLYLNVWKPASAGARLPVLFFIHGGAFSSGSASVPVYDGAALAAQGAIVVSINYRLGVLGFLARPDLTAEGHGSSGNYGVLDMVAALRWVRSNIARFGGDPANVTIAGQSAGAAAVNDLLVSPLAKGLFQRAIAQSGSGMGIAMPTLAEAEQAGLAATQRHTPLSLVQLRQLPAGELLQLTAPPPPAPGTKFRMPSVGFWPNVDHVVLTGNPEHAQVSAVSKVPMLTGFNADEGLMFGAPQSPSDFEEYVRDRYGAFAERVLDAYPHADAAQVAASAALLARDRYMASLVFWVRARSASSGAAIYTYLFDRPYPPAKGVSFGAFHTAEVPYVMGTLGMGARLFSAQDAEFSRGVQEQWLAFVKTGSPALPQQAWPRFDGAGMQVMTPGPGGTLRAAVSTPERFEILWNFVQQGGQLSLF
jgi:para-nitrobenzyl esterase